VTGGNTGIGYWTVLHLAKRHARVFLGCRSAERGEEAVRSIHVAVPHAQVELLLMDLMDLKSVLAAAKEVCSKTQSLHGLVNSAGIMATPFHMTVDGFESQFQTNYLAHWVLTYHLLSMIQATAANSGPGTVRIVNVSSMGHTGAPTGGINFEDTSLQSAFTFKRYGQSKLANILHSKELHRRYGPGRRGGGGDDSGSIWTLALHPGNVDTQLNTKTWGASFTPILRCLGVYITPEEGSFTQLYAVAGEMSEKDSGCYLVPFGEKKTPHKYATDPVLAEKLWAWTEQELRKGGHI
jgi:NAD(P)-dependent dehydrogenase (short-subunit alcohol dehydrogenase family)